VSVDQIVERAPRFTREQFRVTVTARWLVGTPQDAIDISSSGILLRLPARSATVGAAGPVSVETDEGPWSARVCVARCSPGGDDGGEYVGLKYLVGAVPIGVRSSGRLQSATPKSASRPNARPPVDRFVKAPSQANSAPAPAAVSKPPILLPADDIQRLQRHETRLQLVAAALAILAIVLPPALRALQAFLGPQTPTFTVAAFRLPVFAAEAIVVPCCLWRLVRDVHHPGKTSIPRALGNLALIAVTVIAINVALYFAIEATR
jgi:hypothetical protein